VSASHVVVVGSGAVGTISAIEVLRCGGRVTIIDPGPPGGEQAASYGNAGWLSSHSVIPPALPGTWKKVPQFLADPIGPLAVRWSYLPKALPWLVSYLWSGWTAAKVEATALALRTLLKDAPLLHNRLAIEAGVPDLIERQGVMHIYPARSAFVADSFAWSIRRKAGVEWLELSVEELHQRAPELHRRYTFAVLVEEAGRCRDPGAYVAALAAHARELGAETVAARATGLKIENGRLRSVRTETGEILCDRAVIAAGARSKPLCASIGDVLPLETERGYHVMIEGTEAGPRVSFMAADAKLVVNSMKSGLRCAGQVEIAGLEAAPDWRRADILRDHLYNMLPNLRDRVKPDQVKVWMGHRPSMPDGRPCIGYSRASRDVVYAFGHGHVGLAGAARTGRVVAQLIAGAEPEIPLKPFDPRRYL
jgi:D-amino-acid dehydrogenase